VQLPTALNDGGDPKVKAGAEPAPVQMHYNFILERTNNLNKHSSYPCRVPGCISTAHNCPAQPASPARCYSLLLPWLPAYSPRLAWFLVPNILQRYLIRQAPRLAEEPHQQLPHCLSALLSAEVCFSGNTQHAMAVLPSTFSSSVSNFPCSTRFYTSLKPIQKTIDILLE